MPAHHGAPRSERHSTPITRPPAVTSRTALVCAATRMPAFAGRRGQPRVQQDARGAPAAGPVSAGRGRRASAGGKLTARIVEVVAVGRIRRLVRTEAALERYAVALQPRQQRHAAVAEFAERPGRHHVAYLGAQVGEHCLGRVADASRVLLRVPAAGVHHAAGQCGGAAAGGPVEHQHGTSGRGRFQGRAGACRAESHDNNVGMEVPVR